MTLSNTEKAFITELLNTEYEKQEEEEELEREDASGLVSGWKTI